MSYHSISWRKLDVQKNHLEQLIICDESEFGIGGYLEAL